MEQFYESVDADKHSAVSSARSTKRWTANVRFTTAVAL